jgi:acyl-CoA synthetase (NDP forming)
VLDSPPPRNQETGASTRTKGRHTVASHPLIERARQQRRTLLTELESKQVLHDLRIPTTLGQLATSAEDAVRAADTISYPVVLKIASPDIVHKSDVGGVQLHLQDREAVRQAFRAMQQSVAARAPGARIDGIIVQPMAAPGVEVIIGMSKDATFGPVLMFGLGGVLVEVLKDVTFRIVPLSRRDAREMIHDIQGFPVLAGYRGAAPADLEALQNILLTLSAFVESTPEVKEIDLNPIYAYAQGALAVDARVILEEDSASA